MDAFYIILTGALTAIPCALLGSFLMLRRMAMVGDAISHAVLPGIVLAFFISGSRNYVPMLIGATILGMFSTFMIEFFHKKARLQTDAAIGFTFTWLFAIGVILVSVFAGQVDLDQDCVLYGEIAYVPLDMWVTTGNLILGPRAVWIMGSVTAAVLILVIYGYKELQVTAFDPGFSDVAGIRTQTWHYLLMGAVSLTTVAAFESVGAILVVALLLVPAATAYLLTQDLKKLLVLACLCGIIVSAAGYWLAYAVNGSVAGAMAAVSGVLFAGAFVIGKNR
ncbi:MAG: metal ABC transporter permease [Bacteroidota bacterium]